MYIAGLTEVQAKRLGMFYRVINGWNTTKESSYLISHNIPERLAQLGLLHIEDCEECRNLRDAYSTALAKSDIRIGDPQKPLTPTALDSLIEKAVEETQMSQLAGADYSFNILESVSWYYDTYDLLFSMIEAFKIHLERLHDL